MNIYNSIDVLQVVNDIFVITGNAGTIHYFSCVRTEIVINQNRVKYLLLCNFIILSNFITKNYINYSFLKRFNFLGALILFSNVQQLRFTISIEFFRNCHFL